MVDGNRAIKVNFSEYKVVSGSQVGLEYDVVLALAILTPNEGDTVSF